MSDNEIQVYSIYIDAPAQKVWDAITTSEYTTDYGYGGEVAFELEPGGTYTNFTTDEMKQMGMGEVSVSGTVVEADPPRRLVLTWTPGWMPDAETQLTWELTEYPSGLTKVVLTHDLTGVPDLAVQTAGGGEPASGGGGWPWVLSGLKTLLETGRSMDSRAG